MLSQDGNLTIIKKYPDAGKEKVFVKAYHPKNIACLELLLRKQADLKKLLTDEMVCEDKTKNSEIRKAIWGHYSENLELRNVEVELAKNDAKNT